MTEKAEARQRKEEFRMTELKLEFQLENLD